MTTEYSIKTIKELTGLDETERQILMKRYYKTSELMRIDIHKKADEIYSNIVHQKSGERAEKFYSSLLLAIKKMAALEKYLEKKNSKTYLEEEELTRLRMLEMKKSRSKKVAVKKKLVITRFFTLIKKMRDEKFSYRDIASYLKKYHGISIYHTYLRTVFEAEEKRNNMLPD